MVVSVGFLMGLMLGGGRIDLVVGGFRGSGQSINQCISNQ